MFAHATGYRLENVDSGKVYDLPLGLSSCDCPDSELRPRPGGCKHRVGLRDALSRINLL